MNEIVVNPPPSPSPAHGNRNGVQRRRITLRKRIFGAFVAIMAVAFLAMFGGINVATNQFIQTNAIDQLDYSFATFETLETWSEILDHLTPSNVQIFGRPALSLRMANNLVAVTGFLVDSEFNLVAPEPPLATAPMLRMIEHLQSAQINLSTLTSRRISYGLETFYVSAHLLPEHSDYFGRDTFWVGSVDVTDLIWFSREINRLFFWIIVATLFMAAIVTFFLALSITYPIARLSQFAQKVGSGDFTPHDFGFKDMELNHLNMVFNKSVRQLSLYDSQQKTFFQNASHELRTPLMSIKCYAEGIVYDMMEPKEAAETILSETDRLTELVSDLFYISKIDNITTYAKEPVDLVAVLRESAKRQQVQADKKGIGFVFDLAQESILYPGTVELIARAFDNLISNALRYASSEIHLGAYRHKQRIVITVADDGAGIAQDFLPHVFERFTKGPDGNTGVGLSIVQTIFEQMGGSVTVHNNLGAVFTITLPL